MTTRTTADLLTTVAEDISEMAAVAHALDALTSELDLSKADQSKIRDLQKIDALFQHLDDIAALLRKMSDMIGTGPTLDTRDLCAAVRLDYLKTRLNNATHVDAATPPVAGDVNLF